MLTKDFCDVSSAPIGIMDSGIGGLSVWREITSLLPFEDMIYIADNAHCPYGRKSKHEISDFVDVVVARLIDEGCKAVVIACNTATAAAIDTLRTKYTIPFIGMEPAVKPAALHSKSGVIAVLATAGTINGRLFRDTSAKFANGVRTIVREAEGWVELVESGDFTSDAAYEKVRLQVEPLVAAGADYIVLGCTHFPFLRDLISRAAGPNVTILDPAPAVAAQLKRVLSERGLLNYRTKPGTYRFAATASVTLLLRLSVTNFQ